MKYFKFLSTALVMAVATTVTAGSMYITVRAAVQQQDTAAFNAVSPIQVPTLEDPAIPAVDEISVVPAVRAPLPPDQVLHDRSNDIILDAEGGFFGRLTSITPVDGTPSAASQYTVKVLQRGGVIGTTTTDSEGRFDFTELEPGVSGILAFSETGLMLFGVRLVAADDSTAIAGVGEVVELAADSSVVAFADVPLAREMILDALTDGDHRFSEVVSAEDEAFPVGSGEPATSIVSHRVQLEDDGRLLGTVNILDPRTGRNREVIDMTVHFVHDGRVVASARAKNDGSFAVPGLLPGIHSVVGTGRDGVFAIGVDVVGSTYEPVANGNAKDGEFTPASIVQLLKLSVAAVDPGIINQSNFEAVTDGTLPLGPGAPVASSACCGGPMGGGPGGGGFSGGGGGAAGGGGGLAGLLLGAAAGVGGYLFGQNDDDNNNAPASPGF